VEQLYSIVAPTRRDNEDLRWQVMVLYGLSKSICIACKVQIFRPFRMHPKNLINPKEIPKKFSGWLKQSGQVSWSGERKRKVKAMFFKDIICTKFPFGRVCGSPFLASYCAYRSGHNSGTDMLKQLAGSAASCMLILEQNRRNERDFPHFPLPAHPSHWRSRGYAYWKI
jgi:hypothetical protein